MVQYNKNGTATKGKRLLHSGGPRDSQVKLAEHNSIKSLNNLKEELTQITANIGTKDIGYSKEQIETLVNDSIAEVSIDLESKYIKEIEELKISVASKNTSITKLEDKLDKRDSVILELTNRIASITSTGYLVQPTEDIEDSDRPAIDKIFIDPTKKGAEDKYESHVKLTEKKSSKDNVNSSVEKLKALMGNKISKI